MYRISKHAHETAGVVELRFRGPKGGAPASRRFSISAPLSQLYIFVHSMETITGNVMLCTVMPRKVCMHGMMGIEWEIQMFM
jgi:hypothetical protein